MTPVQAQVLDARENGLRAEQGSTNDLYPFMQASCISAGSDIVAPCLEQRWTACTEPGEAAGTWTQPRTVDKSWMMGYSEKPHAALVEPFAGALFELQSSRRVMGCKTRGNEEGRHLYKTET